MFSKADIEQYFNAEKQESLLFLLIGIAAIITAVVFFFLLKTSFYKGIAIPVIVIGILMGVVGYTVYKRSDEDRKRNVYAYDMSPSDFKEKELPRMKAVMKSFVVYRYTEIFLFLVGAGLFLYFMKDVNNSFWKGIGLGLACMALIALATDFFAENRGKNYTKGIESFINKT